MNIRPAGAENFHTGGQTDGQTDMTSLRVAVRKFCERT